MKRALIALIRAYQKHISPAKMMRGCCRFIPTCSQYAIEALETHGLIKGLFLSIYRVLRCNPFCRGGYDPVPPKKQKTSKKGRK